MLLVSLDWNPHYSRFLIFKLFLWVIDLYGKHSQVERLAGGAHLFVRSVQRWMHEHTHMNKNPKPNCSRLAPTIPGVQNLEENRENMLEVRRVAPPTFFLVLSSCEWFVGSALNSPTAEKTGKPWCHSLMSYWRNRSRNMFPFWSIWDFCSCAAHLETIAFSLHECPAPAKLPTWVVCFAQSNKPWEQF